jgi:16S rRNA (guanine1207-N2)-methyltransferase
MSRQYFSSNPLAPHDRREIVWTLPGRRLHLITDSGVFSREGVDRGSAALVASLPHCGGKEVLELGCGYGPILLAVKALFPGASVTGVEVNRRALALCRQNAAINGLEAEILESNGFSALTGRLFDIILTNPPIRAGKEVYYPWFGQAEAHLRQGGRFLCVIQKKQGAPSAQRALAAVFGQCEVINRVQGFWILESIKNKGEKA